MNTVREQIWNISQLFHGKKHHSSVGH